MWAKKQNFCMVLYLQNFCAWHCVIMNFKLIRITCQARCHAKTEYSILFTFKNQ